MKELKYLFLDISSLKSFTVKCVWFGVIIGCYIFEAWHMELHWENCVIMIKIILVTYPICHKKEKEFSRVWKGSTGS